MTPVLIEKRKQTCARVHMQRGECPVEINGDRDCHDMCPDQEMSHGLLGITGG